MNKEKLNELVNKGYKAKVYIKPNKNYTKNSLSCMLISNSSDIVYPVYYNHIKSILNEQQIEFINLFKKAQNIAFNDRVELNIKLKQNILTVEEIKLLTMYKEYKKEIPNCYQL